MNIEERLEEFKRWKEIPSLLAKRGKEILAQPYQLIEFTRNSEADKLLNDLENYPHAFVLGCIMDRKMKAERAWLIPYRISLEMGSFQFKHLLRYNLKTLEEIFTKKNLHRFSQDMAKYFYLAIRRINDYYDGDASNIWKNKPSSATVVRRFLQFHGVGIKIASMAVNILARDFKLNFKDKLCVDISPDVQVTRVFKRLGLIDNNASHDELIYRARELNPEYPGVFDVSTWEIGRYWCRPNPDKMKCSECYLDKYCPKII